MTSFEYDRTVFSVDVPEQEPERQQFFMARCRQWVKETGEALGRPLTCYIATFGCPCVLITEKISQYPLLVL